MVKCPAFILVILLFFSNCFADTFIHRDTGESFNGYPTQIKRRNKTQVRIDRRRPRYLDLSEYEVQRNYLGRKNKVFAFSIKDPINFIYEAEVFEKAIAGAANQGPLFILVEIDVSGGRTDLARRICATITQIDSCRTVAFVSGGKFGGAFSAGAMIALACGELYMADDTAIGAAPPVLQTSYGIKDERRPYRQTVVKEVISADRADTAVLAAYIAALAERNNRPAAVARAMVDKNIGVAEVIGDGKTDFVEPENMEPNQTFVRTWSKKQSLLTLTASEALHCNIADKIIPAIEQLLTTLDAPKATIVQNTGVRKAKRRFEKAKEEFDEITPAVMYLEERADELLEELNELEQRIRRNDSRRRRRSFYRFDGYVRYRYDWYFDEILISRESLINELLFVFRDLRRLYERAIRLAGRHSDLSADIDSLVEGLNSAISKFDEVRNRPWPTWW